MAINHLLRITTAIIFIILSVLTATATTVVKVNVIIVIVIDGVVLLAVYCGKKSVHTIKRRKRVRLYLMVMQKIPISTTKNDGTRLVVTSLYFQGDEYRTKLMAGIKTRAVLDVVPNSNCSTT